MNIESHKFLYRYFRCCRGRFRCAPAIRPFESRYYNATEMHGLSSNRSINTIACSLFCDRDGVLLSLLIWQLYAWPCSGTSLLYNVTIPANSLSANCGWFTFQFQIWCPSDVASFVSPTSQCSLETLTPEAVGNTSCQPSPLYGSCMNSASCLQTVSAPGLVELCFVMANYGNASVTCDVSMTGATYPQVSFLLFHPSFGSGSPVKLTCKNLLYL